ncbi:hypothetical protein M513_03319 [Trichuris suis]|uniref:Uncharacterized protein n=1 Tax=Trichuris suis TaxID=68888 RepID=A0A085MF84_9BILA|nr:hypothetical protein M513_03319 [Trichuris suis]
MDLESQWAQKGKATTLTVPSKANIGPVEPAAARETKMPEEAVLRLLLQTDEKTQQQPSRAGLCDCIRKSR